MEVVIGTVIEFWVPRYVRVLGVVRKFNPAGNVAHIKILGAVPRQIYEGLQPCRYRTWSINLQRRISKLDYYTMKISVDELYNVIASAKVEHMIDFKYPPGSIWDILTIEGSLKKT